MLETLDYTTCIGSTPTFLYLYLYSAYTAHYIFNIINCSNLSKYNVYNTHYISHQCKQNKATVPVKMISIFQIIESIATNLRNNDIRLDLKLNVEIGDYEGNTKAKQSGEMLARTSDKVELCSDVSKAVPEAQPISHLTLSEDNVTPGDSTSCVKPEVTKNEELKEACFDCTECRIQRCDPSPKEMSMCLHAAVYKVWWTHRCNDS